MKNITTSQDPGQSTDHESWNFQEVIFVLQIPIHKINIKLYAC